jgi:hypothetical protein
MFLLSFFSIILTMLASKVILIKTYFTPCLTLSLFVPLSLQSLYHAATCQSAPGQCDESTCSSIVHIMLKITVDRLQFTISYYFHVCVSVARCSLERGEGVTTVGVALVPFLPSIYLRLTTPPRHNNHTATSLTSLDPTHLSLLSSLSIGL